MDPEERVQDTVRSLGSNPSSVLRWLPGPASTPSPATCRQQQGGAGESAPRQAQTCVCRV